MKNKGDFNKQILNQIIEDTFSSIKGDTPGSCKKLRGLIRFQLAKIKAAYKKALSREVNIGVNEWLLDNFYVLEREGRTLLRELSSVQKVPLDLDTKLPVVYLLFSALCKINGGILDLQVLDQYIELVQQRRYLTNRELDILPLILRACLIGSAYTEIYSRGANEKRAERMGNAIASLREFASIEFSEFIDKHSYVEKILGQDPSGIYPLMDEKTRMRYRKQVSFIAELENFSEAEVAHGIIKAANMGKTEREKHVGYYLLELDWGKTHRRQKGIVSLILQAALPLVAATVTSAVIKMPAVAILLYLPFWEIFRPFVEYFAMRGVEPDHIPKIELERVVPKEAATVVVVSTLLPGPDKAYAAAERLERLYHSNGRGEVYFCFLADLKQSKYPNMPEDIPAINAMKREVRKLNQKYGGRFFLCIRPRTFVKTQQAYSGWERKRGAITQLVRLICGQEQPFSVFEGNLKALQKCKYIVALDSDTELLLDTTAELVGAAMHPLNQPVIDNEKGIVERGYGIIVPRIGVDLKSAGKTGFSRTMAGCGGITAYDTNSGNFYQDLFGEAIFAGKGLINVAAFNKVMDNILPIERVLSHDILESAFLRAGLMSEVEMLDGFPSTMSVWFDRLHRWIRGDWQNIAWIMPKVRLKNDKRANPLSGISRFKLFDNIRRPLTVVFSFAILILSLFMPSRTASILTLIAMLSVTIGNLFNSTRALIAGGMSMLSRKYFSRVMPSAMENLAQASFFLMMLVKHALVSADAIVRALWRSFVSKRNLLEWTTAADSERSAGDKIAYIKSYGLAELIGIAIAYFSTSGLTRFVGLFFVFLLPAAYFYSRPSRAHQYIPSREESEKLFSYAAAMWQFFEDYCGESENYLPCDNVQEAPVHAVVHRTSPTNIGLMLLCFLAARDLRFIDSDTLYIKLKNSLNTILKLEKYNGNLYNWYDTRTLKPLFPRYVSTIDSGNFVCCLVALAEGVKDYFGDTQRGEELLSIINKLRDETDLTIFYNKRRRLFHIGYDMEKQELSNSYYDLLMSEARMTSYYAVASRQIPKKHWGALGRTLARFGGYAGPVSWTGTMFEFYMPHLLLPVFENSLGFEALRFCLSCQRKRAAVENVPWGVSESGFYAFDAQLNYQYKAHGVQKLGLKRGLDTEMVVSPYSTFLTMPFETTRAIRNLERLNKYGIFGRYGFYEAIDFTRGRVGKGGFAIVRSYMSHHVGMSLLSVCNTLYPKVMHDRFMRDKDMQSAVELLQEKIPSGAVIFDDIMQRDVPDKPGRKVVLKEKYDQINALMPHVHLLSNGEWTLAISDTGAGVSIYRGIDITRRSQDILRRPLGFYAIVKAGGNVFSITSAPDYKIQASHRVEFTRSYAAFYAKKGIIEAGMMASIHPMIACEQRQILLKNHSQKKQFAKLLLYFEPCLTTPRDDAAHPAFSKLFIESDYDKNINALIFSRRIREKETPLYLAVGLLENVPFEFETLRENILTRPDGIESLLQAVDKPFGYAHSIPDPAAAIRVGVELQPKGQKSVTIFMCAAASREEAVARLLRARAGGALQGNKSAVSPLEEGGIENRLAATVLPQLMYPLKDSRESLEAIRKNRAPATELWGLGISGDYPIVAIYLQNSAEVSRAEPYMRLLRILQICGIKMELVIIYKEGGDYTLPILASIKEAAKKSDAEHLLSVRGGIHPIDLARYGEEAKNLIYAAACHIVPESLVRIGMAISQYSPAKIHKVKPLKKGEAIKGMIVTGGVFSKDTFTVTKTPKLPWCNVLANPSFGTLVSDCALGFTWAFNSRENKLTPWYNDTRSDNRGEMLLARINGKLYDLIYGSRATFSPREAVYECEVEGLSVTVTVSVPEVNNYKQCKVEIFNPGNSEKEISLAYYTEPVLGVDRSSSRHIVAQWVDKKLLLQNSWNSHVKGTMYLTCIDAEPDDSIECCCDRGAFLSGRWSDHTIAPLPDPCGAVIVSRTLKPGKNSNITFVLGYDESEQTGSQVDYDRDIEDIFTEIKVKTPDEKLDYMVNTWALNQAKVSRVFARTGFYQNGGAWGFRDQLQDMTALIVQCPDRVKQHIARCAARQFEEGDVLHWWHTLPHFEGRAKGVRTRYSDDLLWLVYTVCEYVAKTGDYSILDIEVHYLKGDKLDENEAERYFVPERSEVKESIMGHCIRAIERSLNFGQHGLPLIGGGDWNDSFNKVGIKGKGESVWLGMFLCIVLEKFAPILKERGEAEKAQYYIETAKKIKDSIDANCWDGQWYQRAFYDNGDPMGSHKNSECCIDSLSQSFATLCNMPDKERLKTALQNAYTHLVDEQAGIIRLFTPSFDRHSRKTGYVNSYPPGIRENGGQYTHAAIWLAIAFLRSGDTERGYKLIDMLNPASRSLRKSHAERYGLEPYFLAADIYTNKYCYGRGGWSIYTGAAGWFYRAVVEELLGLEFMADKLFVEPKIPPHWDGFEVTVKRSGATIEIKVKKGSQNLIEVDGNKASFIPLDDKNHNVNITIAK